MLTATSEARAESRLYVWVWLPGQTQPVPAGVLIPRGETILFAYGKRYLQRSDAVSLSPTLPLSEETFGPQGYMVMPSAIRDASPDAWGRRVILNRLTGSRGPTAETADLSELTYLFESESNRIGALDFQRSPLEYVSRGNHASKLPDLLHIAELVSAGEPLPKELHDTVLSGTGIGGARPKALVELNGVPSLVKFSVSNDVFPSVEAEALASNLALRVGLNTSAVHAVRIGEKYALASERFDRGEQGSRRMVISGLTIVERDEVDARYGSYPELLERLRLRTERPEELGSGLFTRIAFNMMISNNDDHLRNHAAFWDGHSLELTPAYDLAPMARREGAEITQTLAYGADGEKLSNLHELIRHSHIYGLSKADAAAIVDQIRDGIGMGIDDAANEMEISRATLNIVRGSFLHDTVLRDL